MLLILFAGISAVRADDFVTVSGKKLKGRDGSNLVMRGTNCGNWMIREPYMMNTSGNLDRQFKFDKMLEEICGAEKVHEFDSIWMDNNFNEADMQFIAEHGFNTLRVPMHYKFFTLPIEKEPVAGEQTWLDEGFTRIDSMCVWAERHNILLILDMHACPGGQSSGDICDYDSSKPSLWEAKANRTKLIALWKKIAERYKNEKCVAAYDLINETNWTLANSNKLLWDTFKDIIAAIREVDQNHIVILEGNSYSNDYNGLPSAKMDPKMMLQFHRYGVYNTKESVKYMEDLATRHNCPVYIGEFGENSNSWTAGNIQLFEEGMGFAAWSCWPMKKSNINAILQVKRVSAYDDVISQYQNGSKPSSTTLWNACRSWALAQNIKRCTVRTDYIDALIRRPFTNDCIPFAEQVTNDYVYAAKYDMGPAGKAYWDTDDASYQYNGEDYTNWQTGWVYRNDGVDVYSNPDDARSCGYYIGQTKDGEWLQYTIENPYEAAKWTLQLRYAINSGSSKVRITVNDRPVTSSTTLSATGGYTTWSTKQFENIILPEGTLRVRIYIEKGGLNINWLRFTNKKEATDEELAILEPDNSGDRNLLMNGECEFSGAWGIAAVGSINNTRCNWNYTADKPSKGEGGALRISSARESGLNCAVYQPVEVIAGHVYQADVAVKGTQGNENFWIQAFMTYTEPKDYADEGMQEANTMGQLNSWQDGTLATFDGMMSAKAKAGGSHTAGVMKWKASRTGTAYFALKVGSNKNSFSYTFDNFTLTDLTEAASIEDIRSNDTLYTIEGSNLSLMNGAHAYNTQGQAVSSGTITPGIYIITNGTRSEKVVVK